MIIDRRKNGRHKLAGNRKKFIDRYRKKIKESVDSIAHDRSIKDVANKSKIKLKKKDLDEPTFEYDPKSGKKDYVFTGNDTYNKGDKLRKPQSDAGQGTQGSNSGEGEDDFVFTLTREEFLDLYFSDMALPNFIKESLAKNIKYKWQRSGYIKEGIPARLDIKKTFEYALGRKIATEAQGKEAPFLDEVDIRYRHYDKKIIPVKQAVMFCIMDVSASMGEHEKSLAKKFFLLLYLFLHKEYEQVEIVFIRHTHEAEEVDEETFFYSKETGGTVVSESLKLVNTLIEERYDLSETNVYVAQASDGDNWKSDDAECLNYLESEILPKVQYYAYIQTMIFDRYVLKMAHNYADLYHLYETIVDRYPHFNIKLVYEDREIYPVLHELFKKE